MVVESYTPVISSLIYQVLIMVGLLSELVQLVSKLLLVGRYNVLCAIASSLRYEIFHLTVLVF